MVYPFAIFAASVMLAFFCFPDRAHAYLDPGTGSMVLQAVLAFIAAASVSIGIFWRRIKAFFSRSSDTKEKMSDGD